MKLHVSLIMWVKKLTSDELCDQQTASIIFFVRKQISSLDPQHDHPSLEIIFLIDCPWFANPRMVYYEIKSWWLAA